MVRGIRRGNYTQHRGNERSLNNNFWVRIQKMEENVKASEQQLINLTTEYKARVDLAKYRAPYKYGGLRESWEVYRLLRPSGVSVVCHFKNEPHLNKKDKDHPKEDNFTNPELVGWLQQKPKGAAKLENMQGFINSLAREYSKAAKKLWKEVVR